jgi:hypothetical protein
VVRSNSRFFGGRLVAFSQNYQNNKFQKKFQSINFYIEFGFP